MADMSKNSNYQQKWARNSKRLFIQVNTGKKSSNVNIVIVFVRLKLLGNFGEIFKARWKFERKWRGCLLGF